MKRKKSPNKAQQMPQKVPVMCGDVFATFLHEAQSLGNEVVARRKFDEDVVAFLKEKGLFAEWQAWLGTKNKRES